MELRHSMECVTAHRCARQEKWSSIMEPSSRTEFSIWAAYQISLFNLPQFQQDPIFSKFIHQISLKFSKGNPNSLQSTSKIRKEMRKLNKTKLLHFIISIILKSRQLNIQQSLLELLILEQCRKLPKIKYLRMLRFGS